MKTFLIDDNLSNSVVRLLNDLKIDIRQIRSKINYHNCCYVELSKELNEYIENSPFSYPLFAEKSEEALKYGQNTVLVKTFISRLNDYEPDDEIGLNTENYYCGIRSSELRAVLNGSVVIQVLKENMLTIDYQEYRFESAAEMFYSIGAYIINEINYYDKRIFSYQAPGSDILNVYDVDVHGDFRFMQYDTSIKTMPNMIDSREILPFAKAKRIGAIIGYHSVEASFLASLLLYSAQENKEIEVVANYDQFISKVTAKEQFFGNFADAGDYSHSSNMYLLATISHNNYPCIMTEGNAFYSVEKKGNNLNFYLESNHKKRSKKCSVSINADMLDGLILNLFNKVAAGNGRSSVKELDELVKSFINCDKSALLNVQIAN